MAKALTQAENDVIVEGNAWIQANVDELLSLLGNLVASPSEPGHEGVHTDGSSTVGILWDFLAGRSADIELIADPIPDELEYRERARDNVYAVLPGDGSGGFVCTSHTDIVSPGANREWPRMDPFTLTTGTAARIDDRQIAIETENERVERTVRAEMARGWDRREIGIGDSLEVLIGRGVYDNKGSIVCLVGAMLALEHALGRIGERLAGDLVHGHVVDEEVYQIGAKRMAGFDLPSGWLPERYDTFDNFTAVVLEGSYGFAPVVGHRGLVWIELEATGQSAHASTPHLGRNAVVGMARALVDANDPTYVERFQDIFLDDALLGELTIAGGTTIVGGGVRSVRDEDVERGDLNAIPDWCESTFDLRVPRWAGFPEGLESLRSELTARLAAYASNAASECTFSARIPRHGMFPPVALVDDLTTAREHPLVASAIETTRNVGGYDPEIEVAPGVTDATFLYHGTHMETLVEYGPAGGLSHEPFEFVERDQIQAGMETMLELAIRQLRLAT